jgi:hypothetical protein
MIKYGMFMVPRCSFSMSQQCQGLHRVVVSDPSQPSVPAKMLSQTDVIRYLASDTSWIPEIQVISRLC